MPCTFQTTARDTGLFDHLINLWQFKPGPIPGTCELSILVDFKFNSPLYRQVLIFLQHYWRNLESRLKVYLLSFFFLKVASMFLKEVATRLIGAFSDRCRLVYGPGVPVDENSYEQKAWYNIYNGTNNIRLVFILFARERDYARAFVPFF